MDTAVKDIMDFCRSWKSTIWGGMRNGVVDIGIRTLKEEFSCSNIC